MIVHDVPQRSPEWVAVRLGHLTASCAAEMLATVKDPKKEAAGRRNLRMRLCLERVTGRPQASDFQSDAMAQGNEREADAGRLYEAASGNVIRPVGFCAHDELMAGCSPDGIVGNFEGGVELKSPIAATHWEYLRSGKIPGDYYKQVICGLWITGAEWWDWMSYNPDFPRSLQLKLVRVWRRESLSEIESFGLAASLFLSEVERDVLEVEKMAMEAA